MCFWCPANAKKWTEIRFCSFFLRQCGHLVKQVNTVSASTTSLIYGSNNTSLPSCPLCPPAPSMACLLHDRLTHSPLSTSELKPSFHLICSLSVPRFGANPLRILSSTASSHILISNSARLEWLYLLTRPPSHNRSPATLVICTDWRINRANRKSMGPISSLSSDWQLADKATCNGVGH